MNIISLISSLNVHFVLNKDRVSLANLIDFSNFVDLFVLEDSIYCDEADIEACFNQHFQGVENFPFKPLPSSDLSRLTFKVADKTSQLYDYSPQKFTFSIDSYEYWLSLNSSQKEAIDIHTDYAYTRETLLAVSKRMNEHLIDLFEELGKTNYSLMPSTRNLIPFLDSFHQIETPIFKLYNEISGKHRELTEKVIEFLRPRAIYIPPLLSILLNRCETADEIPQRLSELRDEFTDLRQEIYYWQIEMDQKCTLKDQIELRDEFDNSLTKNAKKYDEKRIGFYKHVGGALLDALEEGNLKKMITKPATAIVKEGMDLLPDKFKSKHFTGIIDIFNEALMVENYSGLLNKIFKDSLDISQYEITNSRKYFNVLRDRYNIKLSIPH